MKKSYHIGKHRAACIKKSGEPRKHCAHRRSGSWVDSTAAAAERRTPFAPGIEQIGHAAVMVYKGVSLRGAGITAARALFISKRCSQETFITLGGNGAIKAQVHARTVGEELPRQRQARLPASPAILQAMKAYLIGADNDALVLFILLQIGKTVVLAYLCYRILTSTAEVDNDYPVP